ncbi:MAG: lysophospholipid acyltransferase family protein [Verrucomicrobiota bacterium]
MSDAPRELSDAPAVVPWYHWVWVVPMALFLRLWLATLRFRCNVDRIDDAEGPTVLLLWHDKLFVSSWIANRYFSRPVTALISTSKDGAWLVAFFKFMGITAVRGSSNRRGAAALITLTRLMRAGNHTGITPDGPKGPALAFKSGAVSLARLTRSPFVVMGIRYHACWRMRSWDRFAMPVPFSRVDVTLLREPMPADGEADEIIVARLQARLNETSTGPA